MFLITLRMLLYSGVMTESQHAPGPCDVFKYLLRNGSIGVSEENHLHCSPAGMLTSSFRSYQYFSFMVGRQLTTG